MHKGSWLAKGRLASGWVVLSLLAMAMLVLTACGEDEGDAGGSPTASSGSGQALKIGILFDFTGDLAEFGPNMLKGAQLAAKHINDAGGVNGRPIELVQADSGTNPETAITAARKLVDIDKVSAIVGSLASGVTLQVASSVTVPAKILLISSASTSPALTTLSDSDYVFRTTISDAAQGVVLAQLANEQGFKKVSTMYVNSPYGQGLSEQFTAAFKKLGGEVPAQVSHEQEQPTYMSELQKAVAGKPDAIAALSYPVSASVYLKEAIENDLTKTFLFCDGTKSLDIIKAVGAQPLEGMKGTVSASAETPKAFLDAYKAQFGQDLPPLPYIAESYDAVVLIALAAQKAESNDSTKIRDSLRAVAADGEVVSSGAEGVKKAIDLIKQGKDVNYEGAAGSQDFDKNGDVLKGVIEIWVFKNGKIETEKRVSIDLSK